MKIHCKHDRLMPTLELKANPQNPNLHPPKQIRLLSKILQETGWRSPIVVSKLSGYVVKGHGRLAAAKRAGFTEVPVDFQDYATKEEEQADLLADNKLAELSQTDMALVKTLLEDFGDDFDLSLTGYETEQAISDAIEEAGVDDEDPDFPIVPVMDEKHSAVIIVCQTEEELALVRELCGLGLMQGYRNDTVAESHVVSAGDFIKRAKPTA